MPSLSKRKSLVIEWVPLIAACSATSWWFSKWQELSAESTSENMWQQLLELLHNGGFESLVFGFLTWLCWIFVLFKITGVDAKHPATMLTNVWFSTAHCVLAIWIGWFHVYEPDWSMNYENRRSSALFCGFTITYMWADLYMMVCMDLPVAKDIVLHHCVCILGIWYAFTSTHQTQLADTIIVYESTGFMFNMYHLLIHFKFGKTHWLFLTNGVLFVMAFTYFRIYLGSALAIHFVYDPMVESRVFVLIALLFHSISLYWYYFIMGELVTLTKTIL